MLNIPVSVEAEGGIEEGFGFFAAAGFVGEHPVGGLDGAEHVAGEPRFVGATSWGVVESEADEPVGAVDVFAAAFGYLLADAVVPAVAEPEKGGLELAAGLEAVEVAVAQRCVADGGQDLVELAV